MACTKRHTVLHLLAVHGVEVVGLHKLPHGVSLQPPKNMNYELAHVCSCARRSKKCWAYNAGLLRGPTRHTKQAGDYHGLSIPCLPCLWLFPLLYFSPLSLSCSSFFSIALALSGFCIHPSRVESLLIQLKGTLLEILLRQKEFDADIRDATSESKVQEPNSTALMVV